MCFEPLLAEDKNKSAHNTTSKRMAGEPQNINKKAKYNSQTFSLGY